MTVAITLIPKQLRILLKAVDTQVESEEARYQREDPAEKKVYYISILS